MRSHRRHCTFTALSLIALSLTGCGEDDLPKVFQLDSLRVLAIKADTPEVSAGSTVTLTALVSDYDRGRQAGSNITASYTLEACIDPGVGYGATPTCTGNSTRTVLTGGTITLSYPTWTTSQSLGSVTVPASSIIFANRSAAEQHNGVAYLVVMSTTSGSQTNTSFRRILVSTRTNKNSNPNLNFISNGGTPLTTMPSQIALLKPSFGSGLNESYSIQLSDGTYESKTELTTVTWLVSEGRLRSSRTDSVNDNEWTPPTAPSRPLFLIPVVRDDRGGVNFLTPPNIGP